MASWLVTWEWMGDHAKVNQPIEAILDGRYSGRRVLDIVELLFANSYFSLSERLGYAKGKRFNLYPARFGTIKGVTFEGEIFCGGNPCLSARKVKDLKAILEKMVLKDCPGRKSQGLNYIYLVKKDARHRVWYDFAPELMGGTTLGTNFLPSEMCTMSVSHDTLHPEGDIGPYYCWSTTEVQ